MARITEIKTISIHEGSFCNPLCLLWKDRFSNFSTWVFEYDQSVSMTTKEISPYLKIDNYLENSEGFERVLGKEAVVSVQLVADKVHNIYEMPGLMGLLNSKEIYEWENGVKKIVTIAPGSFSLYKTGDTFSRFVVTINRGTIYSQLG